MVKRQEIQRNLTTGFHIYEILEKDFGYYQIFGTRNFTLLAPVVIGCFFGKMIQNMWIGEKGEQ